MTGLFGLTGGGRKDPQKKRNAQKAREVRALVRQKRYDEALAAAQEYLSHVPHNHDVLFIAGGIHHMQGRYRQALKYLDHAAEIGSYDTEVLLLKADAHHRLGEDGRARRCCERILEVDERSKGALDLLSRLDLKT